MPYLPTLGQIGKATMHGIPAGNFRFFYISRANNLSTHFDQKLVRLKVTYRRQASKMYKHIVNMFITQPTKNRIFGESIF